MLQHTLYVLYLKKAVFTIFGAFNTIIFLVAIALIQS